MSDSAISADPSDPLIADLLFRCTFPEPATPVVCAVSGGADSSALAVLATARGLDVTLVHVDHGLRPGSDLESDVVETLARRLGVRYRSERVSVTEGPNLEARARQARLSVLPPDVMTGHTADDQAETILMNLLRGGGLRGASGMEPGHRHPLLRLRRRDTRALCDHLGIATVEDPMNADPRFMRVRIRHEVLPLLDDIAGRDVTAVLSQRADVIRDDLEWLDELASDLDPCDARAVATAPPALARAALRRWLANPLPPDSAAVDRVLAVARGERTACELEGGRRVSRHRQRLVITTTPGTIAAQSGGVT